MANKDLPVTPSPVKEETVESLKQREIEHINRGKERTAQLISTLEERLATKTNPKEIERLNNLIALQKNHKQRFEQMNPEARAQERFTRHQEDMVRREEYIAERNTNKPEVN